METLTKSQYEATKKLAASGNTAAQALLKSNPTIIPDPVTSTKTTSTPTKTTSTPTKTTSTPTKTTSTPTTSVQTAAQKAAAERAAQSLGYSSVSSMQTSLPSSSSTSAPKTIAQAQNQAQTTGTATGTFTLLDPSGKAINTNYSAADKAEMERNMLANGYRFVPTTAQTSSTASTGSTQSYETWPTNPTNTGASTTSPTKAPADDVDIDNSPVFMGNQTLVTFTGSSQVFLVDQKDKTIRPFESLSSFRALYGDNADAALALAQKQVISSEDLGPFGSFEGYTALGGEYSIKRDGTSMKYDNSKQAMEARYDSQINMEGELKSFRALDGLLDLMAKDSTSGINENTIKKIQNDKEKVAFYLNALTYGGYSLADVYRDLKKDELGLKVSPISSSESRAQYALTDAGKAAYDNVQISPPADLVGLTADILGLPIYNMPEDAFKTLVPVLDWDSDEFKAKMDEVQSAYHDVIMQQLSAKTEHEKVIADYNWNKFKEETENSFGIRLSDNALTAWDQLEAARDSFSQRGTVGSGMEAEAVDDYLRKIRTSDERSREERKTVETANEANYFLSYATPEQIQKLIEEDKAKGIPQNEWRASKWGLIPSEEVKAGLSLEALKKKFPEMDEKELSRYISSIVDENGNYRSSLYQNYVTNKMGEENNFKQFQMDTTLAKELRKEEDAYKQFTTPDIPFLRTSGDPLDTGTKAINLTMPTKETSKYLGTTPGAITDMSKISGNANIKPAQTVAPAPVATQTTKAPAVNTASVQTAEQRAAAERAAQALGHSSMSAMKTTLPSSSTSTVKPTVKPTVTTSSTSSKTTVKTPTGSSITMDSSFLTPERRQTLSKQGYTFI
jgi:hypothetical protein